MSWSVTIIERIAYRCDTVNGCYTTADYGWRTVVDDERGKCTVVSLFLNPRQSTLKHPPATIMESFACRSHQAPPKHAYLILSRCFIGSRCGYPSSIAGLRRPSRSQDVGLFEDDHLQATKRCTESALNFYLLDIHIWLMVE